MAIDATGTDGLAKGAGAADFDDFINATTTCQGFGCSTPLGCLFVVDQVVSAQSLELGEFLR